MKMTSIQRQSDADVVGGGLLMREKNFQRGENGLSDLASGPTGRILAASDAGGNGKNRLRGGMPGRIESMRS